MKLKLKISGKPYEIDADSDGDDSFTITVNNRKFNTVVGKTDDKEIAVKVQDKAHRLVFDGEISSSAFFVEVNGKKVEVEIVRDKKPRPPKRDAQAELPSPGHASPDSATSGAEAGAILSPMPGTVLAVDKKVGDEVKQGDRILTIEAMKMENEIRAKKPGKIKEIRVSVGATVLAHDVLAVIE